MWLQRWSRVGVALGASPRRSLFQPPVRHFSVEAEGYIRPPRVQPWNRQTTTLAKDWFGHRKRTLQQWKEMNLSESIRDMREGLGLLRGTSSPDFEHDILTKQQRQEFLVELSVMVAEKLNLSDNPKPILMELVRLLVDNLAESGMVKESILFVDECIAELAVDRPETVQQLLYAIYYGIQRQYEKYDPLGFPNHAQEILAALKLVDDRWIESFGVLDDKILRQKMRIFTQQGMVAPLDEVTQMVDTDLKPYGYYRLIESSASVGLLSQAIKYSEDIIGYIHQLDYKVWLQLARAHILVCDEEYRALPPLPERLDRLLGDMLTVGVQPDGLFLERMIVECTRKLRRVDEPTLQYLYSMLEKYLYPKVDIEDAEGLRVMRRVSVAWISLLAKKREVGHAFDAYRKLQEYGVKLNRIVFHVLIQAVQEAEEQNSEKLEMLMALMAEMRQCRIHFKPETYRHFLGAYLRLHNPSSASTVLESMIKQGISESDKRFIRLDHFFSIMKSWANDPLAVGEEEERWDRIEALWMKMQVVADEFALPIRIASLMKFKDVLLAQSVLPTVSLQRKNQLLDDMFAYSKRTLPSRAFKRRPRVNTGGGT